jgi:transcriptional regulator with XRE-family HTH domain
MKNLRAIRLRRRLTIKACARAVGVHVQTWIRWEKGINEPSWAMGVQLKHLLAVTLDMLADELPDELPPMPDREEFRAA